MKETIDPLEHATEILQGVKKGVLLTTKNHDRVNSMTISWGTLGIEWAKPIFTAFVRQHRFTKEFLEATHEFTVNIPTGQFDTNITKVCGSKSGRDMDKIAELGLTLVEPELIDVPGIKELPLTLECRVRYIQDQDLTALDAGDVEKWYPADNTGFRDFHTVFCGEIVAAYIAR
ncbi:MAG: flavin reductase family protein [Eggerthellaceae bacterium]